jgi:uncharacterized integral membrane protein
MTFDPNRRDPVTGTTTTRSRYDPRGGGAGRWIAYIVGIIVLLLVLLWLFGAFDRTAETVAVPPATTEEGTAAPAAPQ